MLVSSYLTVSPLPARGPAVCFLWHCPAGRPGLPLTTTLPCGVRTFLGTTKMIVTRPPGRLVRRVHDRTARAVAASGPHPPAGYARPMPEPTGAELEAVRERRGELRDRSLLDKTARPPTTARGIHHAAFVCKD